MTPTRAFYGIVHRVRKLFGRNGPAQLWIAVTYNCQCNCEHCVVGPELNKKTDELSREEIRRILREARFLGIRRASFFGGEPLLRRDLPDLIKDAVSLGFGTTVYTNGLLLNQEVVNRLKASGLDRCNISLDSSDGAVHDRFRHYQGCFDKAVEGIRLLVKAGISANIWTHVSKWDVGQNELRDLKQLIRTGRGLGISHIMVLFPFASGNWLCGWNEILTQEERERVRELYDPPFVQMEFPDEMATCTAGRLFVYVKPQGEVTPCPTIPHVFGNVRKEPLRVILRRIKENYCCFTSEHHGECVYNDPGIREKIGSSQHLP